ncbi:MAG: hypothetical protein ACYDA9_18675 [Terriglobia bacterium]
MKKMNANLLAHRQQNKTTAIPGVYVTLESANAESLPFAVPAVC